MAGVSSLFILTFYVTMVIAAVELNEKSQDATSLHARIIHRNSLPSPFPRRNGTLEERLREIQMKDKARGAWMTKTSDKDLGTSVISGAVFDGADYFAVVRVGTPPRPLYLTIDTGSDMTWFQCEPCINCFKQWNRVFNPRDSSTFKILTCDADLCLKLTVMECSSDKICLYKQSYTDGSFSNGVLGTDNVVMDAVTGPGNEVVLGNIPMGCGMSNAGNFIGVEGILGLGKGAMSFPNNIDTNVTSALRRGSVFSYCLPDMNKQETNVNSMLILGEASIPADEVDSVMYTPQIQNPYRESWYYVQMTGISVDGDLLTEIWTSDFMLDVYGKGGTIVDSGTTLSYLKRFAYLQLRDAFRHKLDTTHLKSVDVGELLDTCYDVTQHPGPVLWPSITLHFRNVDLQLPGPNCMVTTGNSNTFCLLMDSILLLLSATTSIKIFWSSMIMPVSELDSSNVNATE